MLIDYTIYQALKKVQKEIDADSELHFDLWYKPELGWQANFNHYGLNPSQEKVYSENPNEVIYAAILRLNERRENTTQKAGSNNG